MEVVGVRAVIDGIQQYIGGARQIEKSTAQMGRAVDDVASKSGKLGAFGSALGGVAKIAGGFIIGSGLLAAPGILSAAANAAAEDAASTAKLQRAVENSGHAYAEFAKPLRDTIALAQKRGFTDDQARDSLSLLTAQTDDAGEAIRRFAFAQDLARGANMDVTTASRLLGKVTDENVSVLARYGIQVDKNTSQAELFAKLQAKFGGQAEAFAKSAAGQAAAARIGFSEFAESIGYIILPAMGALAKLLNSAVVPALNKMVEVLGPRIQAAAVKAKAALQASGISAFVKRTLGDVQTLSKFVLAMWEDFDLGAFRLPARLRPIGDALGILILVLQEVIDQVRTLVRVGGEVAVVLGNMARKVLDIVAPAGKVDKALRGVADNEVGIKAIAGAITFMVAAMAVKTVVDFATGLASVALQVALWPLQRAQAIVGSILDLGRAILGVPARKVLDETAPGVAGINDCVSKTVECVQNVTHTGDKPITDEPIVQQVTQQITKVEPPKNLAASLGTKFAGGIAQGLGVLLAPVLVAALLYAGVPALIAVVVVAAALALAAAAAFAYVFRKQLITFLTRTLPAFLKDAGGTLADALVAGLKALPVALAFIAGAIAAALLVQFVLLPVLLVRGIVDGVTRGVPLLARIGTEAAKAIAKGFMAYWELVNRTLPELIGRGVIEGVKLLNRWLQFNTQELPRILVGAVMEFVKAVPGILRGVPGFFRDMIAAIISFVRELPANVGRIFGELPGVTERGASGVLDVARRIFGAVVELIRNLPFAATVADLMGQVVDGFRRGFETVDNLTGNILSDTFATVRRIASDILAAVLGIPATISSAAGSFFSAAQDLGEAIFGGLMTGLKQTPGMIGAFLTGIKEAVKTAINAAIDAINDAIPDSIPLKIRGIGIDVPIPDNPLPHVALAKGTASFAGGLALLGEHGREFAFLPRGTAVAPANQTNAILRAVASLIPGSSRSAGSTIGISMPISVNVQEFDWSEVRRAIHREVDSSFTASRSRSTRAGAAIGSGIG